MAYETNRLLSLMFTLSDDASDKPEAGGTRQLGHCGGTL